MEGNARARAQKAAEGFKDSLSEITRQDIGSAGFERLALMIEEAISEQLKDAAAQVEDLAKSLRDAAGESELSL